MIPLDDSDGSAWAEKLREAVRVFTQDNRHIAGSIPPDHLQDTPDRVVRAFREYFSGLMEDPRAVLRKGFVSGGYNELVVLSNIDFISVCAHHFVPIIGRAHFGYLPNEQVVGLSKIPRLVEILSRRPQVQEKLTQDIVDEFWAVVKPKGCGVVVDAVHLCMMIRGVRKPRVGTRTTALRGEFMNASLKQEFLSGIPSVGDVTWP